MREERERNKKERKRKKKRERDDETGRCDETLYKGWKSWPSGLVVSENLKEAV